MLKMNRRSITLAAILLVMALLGSACRGDGAKVNEAEQFDPGAEELGDQDAQRLADEGFARGAEPEAVAGGAEADVAAAQVPDLPGDRVIRTASLEVRVADGEFSDAFSKAQSVASELGGFVASSSTSEDSDEQGRIASGMVVIRVPSEEFDEAIERLRTLGEVTAESREGRDVSAEFVDLEGRLRHLRSQETFFLRLIDEAETISDLIQIQGQLSNIQSQIEQIQGRINFLTDRTEFGTISARLFEEGEEDEGEPGPIGQAWRDALDAFESVVAGLIVALGAIAPLAVIGVVAWFAWRAIRRSRAASKTSG